MNTQRQHGFALALVLSLMIVIGLLVTATAVMSASGLRATTNDAARSQAFFAAQTGLQRARAKLNNSLVSGLTGAQLVTNLDSYDNVTDGAFKGTVDGGSFTVTATATTTATGGTVIVLSSEGNDPNTVGNSKIETQYELIAPPTLPSTLTMNAPATLTITSKSKVTGDAPAAGKKNNKPAAGNNYTITCTAPCARTGSPAEMQVTYAKSGTVTDLKAGQYLDMGDPYETIAADGQTKTVVTPYQRYFVKSATMSSATLVPINESETRQTFNYDKNSKTWTPSATASVVTNELSTTPTKMYLRDGVDSIITSGPLDGNGTGLASCASPYNCSGSTINRNDMFKFVFGVDIDVLKQTLGSSFINPSDTAACTMAFHFTTSNKIPACYSNDPRVVVMDLRGQTGTQVVDLTGSTTFKGLLYVIADSNVKIANNASFAGALVLDVPSTASGDASGTGNFQQSADCSEIIQVKTGNNSKDEKPKACYNEAYINTAKSRLGSITLPSTTAPTLKWLAETWREVKSQ
ncbi:pilus assembly PilX family protein [Deinococcus pimensis]|uniref:pilus assembly PilX family protein n=1 Tax=Deinococcus pimensis TaxID=309888 RepID=UPI000480B6E4|nr:pilus assembly PilX N-terminal domain-containing protein [Deinococcus pimensis]